MNTLAVFEAPGIRTALDHQTTAGVVTSQRYWRHLVSIEGINFLDAIKHIKKYPVPVLRDHREKYYWNKLFEMCNTCVTHKLKQIDEIIHNWNIWNYQTTIVQVCMLCSFIKPILNVWKLPQRSLCVTQVILFIYIYIEFDFIFVVVLIGELRPVEERDERWITGSSTYLV